MQGGQVLTNLLSGMTREALKIEVNLTAGTYLVRLCLCLGSCCLCLCVSACVRIHDNVKGYH